MSATKAGNPIWSYHNDFYQEDMLYTNEVDEAYMEAVQMIREYELQLELEQFELWQDDPAFLDEEDDHE
jgi:hypothetical protein